MSTQVVPFGTLAREYEELRLEIDAAVMRVLASGRFLLGDETCAFEEEFASWLGVEHVVTCASGTEAITLALMSLGVGSGDEVILPVNTCVPSATGIRMAGATPIPVDVDPSTLMMSATLVAGAVRERTKAILPVHLYGAPVDLEPLLALGIPVVEDCAQAHGAMLADRHVGSLGAISCFSFYPSKNLGAYGDGGAVATNDADLAARARMLRQYGQERRNVHRFEGINSRMDEIQAAVLRVKLPHLDAWTARRRALAALYARELPKIEVPTVTPAGQSVHHLYPVLVDRRDELIAHLERRGITTLVHYPVPLHLQPCYRSWGLAAETFPVAERAATRLLSLPLFPQLTDEEALTVSSAVREFYA